MTTNFDPKYKEVYFPITVPAGAYCWEYTYNGAICEHYNNTGGHSSCQLRFEPNDQRDGVMKDEKCMVL